MPTYSNPLSIVPTEYVPIDYRHDAMFEMAEAQQTASNIAVVKSRYEDLLGMELTTDKSKQALSGFMKNAETELQKISGMNMLAYDNAKKATDIFKPITDINGQYGYIVGDNAVTNKFKQNESLIERSKTENKGEQYNPAYETILSAQKTLFAKDNNPDNWKTYYYNLEEYKPGIDLTKKLLDLEKAYRDQIGEGTTIETTPGDGTKTIIKDQSINAQKYEEYLDTHLNSQEKEQLLINKKAEYWTNLISYSSITDPTKKADIASKLKGNYNAINNQQIDEEKEGLTLLLESYEKYKAQTPAENTEMIGKMNTEIDNTNKRLKALDGKKLTDQQLDLMINPADWVAGQNLYVNTFTNNELSRIAKSAAVKKISTKTEKDDPYWEQMRINLEMYKAGLKYENGKFINDPGVPETEALKTEEKLNSPEKFGKYIYNKDKIDIATNSSSMKIIDVATGENISERYDKIKDNLTKLTWGEAMEGGYISEDNKRLNTLVDQIRIPDGKGGLRKVTTQDNANIVLASLKQVLSKKQNIDYLIKVNENNPQLRKSLNEAVTSLELTNSKATSLSKNFQKILKTIVPEIEAPDGVKFSQEMGKYKITNPEELQVALDDFSKKHKGFNLPYTTFGREKEKIDNLQKGKERGFWNNAISNNAVALVNTIGGNVIPYSPLYMFLNASDAVTGKHIVDKEDQFLKKLDVEEVMNKFYSKYGETQGDSAFLGYAFHKTRPIAKDKEIVDRFESTVANYALRATDRPDLNKLVKDYTSMVSDVYEGKQGYGVLFSTNIGEGEGKTFLQSYNSMANKDTSGVFETARSVQDAVNNLNTYFKSVRIPTSAINSQDKKYNIDQNLKFASDNRQLTSVNIDPEDLNSLYGLKNQTDVIVGIKNKRAAQLGFDDMDLDMNIHYLRPSIKNGIIERDATGNVKLEHIYGKDIFDIEVKKLMSSKRYTLPQAIEEAKKNIMTNVTDYVTHYGLEARNYLDFIKYLNTSAKNQTLLKNIPTDILNSYLSNNN